MFHRNIVLAAVIVLLGLFLFSIPTVSSTALTAEPQPTSSIDSQILEQQIEQTVLGAVSSNANYVQADEVPNLQVSDVRVSTDQQWATAWVVYYDPQIEAVVPTEPALAVLQYQGDHWEVYLPSDPGWQDHLMEVPEDLLSESEKEMWLTMSQGTVETVATQVGYYLPWHGGDTAYLSRSVGHDADFTTAHYAFDFFLPGTTVCPSGGVQSVSGTTGLNFNVYAAKAATVWGWDDSVVNCDHTKVNFIVLRNVDDPTIFQLYMHLAQGSIPPQLKSVGAPVARGQFIAIADNTGISTGSHLHFQVEKQPTWPVANPYWNTAIDMTFADVPINGGRPRVNPPDAGYCKVGDVCNVFQQTYVSGNYYQGDAAPPTGALGGVSDGQIIQTQTVSLNGWGADDSSGLDYGQLVANFAGSWHDIGPRFNPNFSYTWDLCDPSLPVVNGPISVALILVDNAGNAAPGVGLTNIVKNFTCSAPPPSCVPDANQVTLFEDPFYQGGCVKFGPGDYPTGQSLDPLGNDDADSIMVGSNVIATLYSEENFSGHSQAVTNNNGYMQYDWVPSNTVSSMKISNINDIPQTPRTVFPGVGAIFRAGDVVPFSFINGAGATEYRVELYNDSGSLKTYPWQADPVLFVDSLPEGSYQWRVQGRNSAGSSSWSQTSSFSIQSPIIFPPEETAPYSDTMENTQSAWVRDGLWSYINNASMAHGGLYSWWYQTAYGNYDNHVPNVGSLTSPPVFIPSIGYYLHFYYRYQTETTGTTWDQRWVQISIDEGPFINIMQIVDDPQMPETSTWLRNKAIDLSVYSGHIIRVRFQFVTLDASANNFSGWGIDDFSITASLPENCGENRPDDTPEDAYLLSYDPSIAIPGEICPNGDYDFYKFYGNTGDHIVADVDAMINGSPLDSYLYLLAPDGKTVLAENDDEIYAQLRDPLLSYTISAPGMYYLKLKAWKHPLVGGNDYSYSIRLYEDKLAPSLQVTFPQSGTFLPDTQMTLSANVTDLPNGIDRVEFFWHPMDWTSGAWQLIGTDTTGSDGWNMIFNPSGQPEGNNAAIFIQAFDKAGNWAGSVSWHLGIDKTPPTTQMNALTASQPSNAFLISWTGVDNLSGLGYVEIQEKVGAASWVTLPDIDGSIFQHWIIGNPGSSYSYRMRGIDHSGNTESYPLNAEATTSIPSAAVLCYAPDNFDVSGNDNSPATASTIYVDGASQFHNFCNPLRADYQNDEDWMKLVLTQDEQVLIRSIPQSPGSATVISLFAQDGKTLLAEAKPSKFGQSTGLLWKSTGNNDVYIRLSHLDGRVIGTDVGCSVTVKTGIWMYLPIVSR